MPAVGDLPGAPAKPSVLGMGRCPDWPSTPWGRPLPDMPILPGGPASPVSMMTPVEPGKKGSPVQPGHAGGGNGCGGFLGRTGCWPMCGRFLGSSESGGALGVGRGVGSGCEASVGASTRAGREGFPGTCGAFPPDGGASEGSSADHLESGEK